jgi:membrane protein implicated in regulation of membrane protease activity
MPTEVWVYIVAIAWLYVTLLMAAAETSIVAGVLTFVFYGLAPLSLLLWLFGVPQRRRNRQRRELTREAPPD